MKKIFTCLSLALLSVLSFLPVNAQNITKSQEQTIKEKLIPVVFDQIKQRTGIDLVALANPQFNAETLLTSPLFNGDFTSLRSAANPDTINIIPDSVILYTSTIDATLSSVMGSTVKMTFSGNQVVTFPMAYSGHYININLPKTVKVASANSLIGMTITFTYTPAQSIYGSLVISAKGNGLLATIDGNLMIITSTIDAATYLSTVTVAPQTTLTNLLSALKTFIPKLNSDSLGNTYILTFNLAGVTTTAKLPLAWYIIPSGTKTQVPLGAANVYLDLAAYAQGSKMPIKKIDVTQYTQGKVTGYAKLVPTLKQATTTDLVLNINKYGYTSAEMKDSVYAGATIITMTDYTKAATKAFSLNQIINNVIRQAEAGNTIAPYQMRIDSVIPTGKDTITQRLITVTPTLDAAYNLSADINMYYYTTDGSIKADSIDMFKVTCKSQSPYITLSYLPDKFGNKDLLDAYFTSNLYGVIQKAAANEEINATGISVYAANGELHISGAAGTSYQIVSMNGAIVANGRITVDNAIVPTGYASGVYIVTLKTGTKNASFKFIEQ